MDSEIIDFRFIEQVDTRQNFIIKCEDYDEFSRLCILLSSKSKVISFETFEKVWEKHCS